MHSLEMSRRELSFLLSSSCFLEKVGDRLWNLSFLVPIEGRDRLHIYIYAGGNDVRTGSAEFCCYLIDENEQSLILVVIKCCCFLYLAFVCDVSLSCIDDTDLNAGGVVNFFFRPLSEN